MPPSFVTHVRESNGAQVVSVRASGSSLSPGQIGKITDSTAGYVTCVLADSTDAGADEEKYVYILENISAGTNGEGIITGTITGVDTSTYTAPYVWLNASGTLSNTPSGGLVQLGKVNEAAGDGTVWFDGNPRKISYLKPEFFGPVGTANDAAAIQAAYDSTVANTVALDRMYSTTSTLTFDDPTKAVIGFGHTTGISYTGSGAAIQWGGGGFPTVDNNQTLDFFKILTGGSATAAIKMSGVTRAWVRNLFLEGTGQSGVGIEHNEYSWLVQINGCYIKNFDVGIRYRKITPNAATQVFNGNDIINCPEITGCNWGIIVGDEAVSDSGTVIGQGLTIRACHVEGNDEGGVWIAAGDGIVFADSYAEANGDLNIRVGSASTTTARPRHTLIDNVQMQRELTIASIDMVKAERTDIRRCRFLYGAGKVGIQLTANAEYTRIWSDNFWQTGITKVSGAGTNTIYQPDDGSLIRRWDSEIFTDIESAPATDGSALATPRVRFRAHYDSNPAGGSVTDSELIFYLLAQTSIAGASPEGFIQLEAAGGAYARIYRGQTAVRNRHHLANGGLQVHVAAQNLAAAGDDIDPSGAVVEITNTSGGPMTLTSTPTISGSLPGQVVTIINVGSNSVTLQDEGTLAGSGFRAKSGANVVLSQYQSIQVVYSANVGAYIEV